MSSLTNVPEARTQSRRASRPAGDALLLAAPLAALLAGCAAQWLDFQALRYPLLLLVGVGVLATAHALSAGRTRARTFAIALALGIATWAVAETVYVLLHVAMGERFEAERFGPQPVQALGLIAVHGVALGAPTGAVAGIVLAIAARRRRA